MAERQGPWVQMALFCNMVVEDTTGALTIVRVVDRVIHFAEGPGAPVEMPPVQQNLWLVVSLKAGEAVGKGTVAIDTEGPDGITHYGPSVSVLFESPDRGANVIVNAQFRFEKEGLYWFNVRYDGELLTRIPLRVVYQPSSAPTPRVP